MDHQNVALLIPIIITSGAFIMVWGLRYLQNKENMAMIEKGMDPRTSRRKSDPSATLKNALIFIGAGLGLLISMIVNYTFQVEDGFATGITFSLIAILGGAGALAAYLYDRDRPTGANGE